MQLNLREDNPTTVSKAYQSLDSEPFAQQFLMTEVALGRDLRLQLPHPSALLASRI